MSKLTNEAFMYCLFDEGEDTTNHVKVRGFNSITFGLHPQRLEEKRELVIALLDQLSEKFKEGSPAYNLCFTKNGELWTDNLRVCEQLVVMASGLELMEQLDVMAMGVELMEYRSRPLDWFQVRYIKIK